MWFCSLFCLLPLHLAVHTAAVTTGCMLPIQVAVAVQLLHDCLPFIPELYITSWQLRWQRDLCSGPSTALSLALTKEYQVRQPQHCCPHVIHGWQQVQERTGNTKEDGDEMLSVMVRFLLTLLWVQPFTLILCDIKSSNLWVGDYGRRWLLSQCQDAVIQNLTRN